MYRKNSGFYITVAFITLLIFSFLTIYAASATKKQLNASRISARAAVLYEPETDTFLFEKNADERLPMASTTKIMTAIVAIENSSLDEQVAVDDSAIGTEGSSAYLKSGDILTMEELLYALMLSSANDAAVAIACHVSGSIEEFAALMNEKAEELGLVDTHFSNPHGLDDEDHYTTARELAIIAKEALSYDILKEISSTYKKSFITEDRSRTYVNHNKLLHKYDGAIGLKTGYTKKCGRCLVGAAERDGLSFITVTIDAPSDWNDHALMLDFGYDTLEKVMLADVGEYSYELGVVGGKDEKITVTNTTSLSYIKDRNKGVIDRHVRLVQFAEAPVTPSDTLGEVIFTLDGREIGRISLYPCECVEKAKSEGLLKKLKSIFDG